MMMELVLLDGQVIYLNPDHLLKVEGTPDTLLTLSTGDKWLVRESVAVVRERFMAYQQACFQRVLND
jgi:flagellar protein FlbD